MDKKLFVLGKNGMAGHVIYNYFKENTPYKTIGIARDNADHCVDIETYLPYLEYLIKENTPDIIINCIGLLVKASQDNPDRAIYINSFFPRRLEQLTKNTQTKIIHLSTDCCFSGTKGNHLETDIPTETSWYGRTKAMGELNNTKDLTLRMSIIGSEIKTNGTGLFEWVMKQKGQVKGFDQCLWNGLTTLQLSKQIENILNLNTPLTGLYHLAPSFNINKYDLLCLINEIFDKKLEVIRDSSLIQNKTLHNSRVYEYNPYIPSYEQQLIEMKAYMEKYE